MVNNEVKIHCLFKYPTPSYAEIETADGTLPAIEVETALVTTFSVAVTASLL